MRLSQIFPIGPEATCKEECVNTLISQLPDELRASSLCETYMEHGTWGFQPITRDELINEIFIPTYKLAKDRREGGGYATCAYHYGLTSPKLAVLYMVFALGALVDLTLRPCTFMKEILGFGHILRLSTDNIEAQRCYHLARAALSLRSMYIFESPEMSTVQAICLISIFNNLMGQRGATDSSVCTFQKHFTGF